MREVTLYVYHNINDIVRLFYYVSLRTEEATGYRIGKREEFRIVRKCCNGYRNVTNKCLRKYMFIAQIIVFDKFKWIYKLQ